MLCLHNVSIAFNSLLWTFQQNMAFPAYCWNNYKFHGKIISRSKKTKHLMTLLEPASAFNLRFLDTTDLKSTVSQLETNLNCCLLFQIQQTSKRMDTEVCYVRTPGRSKYKWEQKNPQRICYLIQMNNGDEGNEKLKTKQPTFWEGSDTMWYGASWFLVCWAATMCCPSLLV